MTSVRARSVLALAAGLLIGAGAAWVFWPGVAMYDSVAQYQQVVSGQYDDWHPPIMARLWALLHAAFGGGAAPMFVLQLALYALGFGLLAQSLAATGRWRGAIATLVLAGSPLLLGWQTVVLKDAQMLGALIAAMGIVAAFRLRERQIPFPALAVVVLLIGYATLVRANAAFATVPLVVLLAPRPVKILPKLAVVGIATLFILGVTPLLNHHLFRAEPSGVAKSQPLFDLAGIAVRTPPGDSAAAFTPGERALIVKRHCAKAFFWDPLGDDQACASATARLDGQDEAMLYRLLARAVVAHPLAYAGQRLAHWNSTERWLVAPGLPSAAPGEESEPNALGLVSPPHPFAATWDRRAMGETGTPLGWPIVWTFLALVAVSVAGERRETPAGSLALALAGSAVGLESSFLLVSIASDLRYHLWPMTAAALALILLADGTPVRRMPLIVATALLTAIIASGLYTRATRSPAPTSYRAMIDAPTG